ncbi:MAG: MBL fold metallo-hydrolase [Burkholderiales bacterium]|jgi:glyoxylase-like metal-dependent hydrolase (beta-lactamase superfamily II)|nr:MBL fold metallo-hydrolase [Burkholderiales bacterium]
MMVTLPDTIRFIERDWLAANHVMFRDSDAATLVDTGYGKFNDVTLEKVGDVLSDWGDLPLERIINTHIHSDHIGGNAALQRAHPGCSITIPLDEQPALVNWDAPDQMLSYADQAAERFAWDAVIEAGETISLGGEAWEAIATPGHDMGSLVLFSPKLRILISADALWENGFGFVVPQAIDPRPLAAQRATFKRLAALDVALVIPGHGPMFTDFSGALKRASDKLEAFAADDMRIVRNVVKGMFIYSLMWREQMLLSDLPSYVNRIGVHRDYNAQFFKMSDEAFADWLVAEALRAGKARVDGGRLVST